MTAPIETYYARRAREYERIYAKPERQADLARLRDDLPRLFTGAKVLEIACGTGYWTPLIAGQAANVLAVDAADEVLEIARNKALPRAKVRFERADAYALPDWKTRFDACFAGFWWSHVPLARLDAFLAQLHARLEPNARVVFLDNRYVEGSSTPLSRSDAEGNTYQLRRLDDGSTHEVLKNFPGPESMARRLGAHGSSLDWQALEYYWVASYRIPR
jgi:demethylmenaquinone methyltransferase/2-methoxy-6-polyprenyl-1,4-benzoquinol methylase